MGLASHPVSASFRERVEARVGAEVDVLDLQSLRRLPPPEIVRRVRAHRGKPFLLLLEDTESSALLPVVSLLATVGGARSLAVVGADGRVQTIPRRAAVRAAGTLATATAASRRSARLARRELSRLLRASRGDFRLRASSTRVLYLNANLWFGLKAGGSIGHVAGVANGFLDQGLAVDVAAVAPQPGVRGDAGFLRLSPPSAYGLPPELNQYRFSRSVAARVARTLTPEHRFLYQRLSLGNYAGAVLSRRAGIPLVLEYNGSEVWIARHWGMPLRREELALAAEDASLRHAQVVVTVSQVLGDELLARGVEQERIVVYPNCVDPEVFDPDRLAPERERRRAELGLDDHTVVTFVGTFGRWHGAEVLARAIATLAVEEPRWLERHRVRFLLVGDGLRMPLVREALGEPGGRVTILTGLVPQHEAPSYLAASDVLVSPHVPNEDGSRFFGSPTKLFEYMAMGKAIVASDLDQIGDVLRPALAAERSGGATTPDGALAILCPPGDVGALTAAIQLAVEDPRRRAVLGANARRRALERYTWDHHVRAILDRLEAVAGGG